METKIQNSILGDLVWDEKFGWWNGKAEVQPNLVIKVSLSGDQEEIVKEIIQFQKVFEKFRADEIAARNFAADKLLELHNESWREEDEELVTHQEFCQRIQLESIVIYDDKSAEIYYQDDDLFWGHIIIVSMNEKGIFEDANIAG